MLLQLVEPVGPSPHENDQGVAIGIDLGTTNSLVAVSVDGKAIILSDPAGKIIVPSVVAYGKHIMVGHDAQKALFYNPGSVVRSIKRLLGRSYKDVEAHSKGRYEAINSDDEGMVRLRVGESIMTPIEISADILKALKTRAEKALTESVDRAVITVPAYFDDAARAATRDAARLAGLEVLRLVSEPTAAALAYGLDLGVEGLYAIYDLGGGTFDFSLLHLEKGVFQVLATGGDAALGGDEFDQKILTHLLSERATEIGPENYSANEMKLALDQARALKERLTIRESGACCLVFNGTSSKHIFDRSTFDSLVHDLISRTLDISKNVLIDAKKEINELQGVVLVGGSTRIPMVVRAVEDGFGQPPLNNVDPDETVALGAALQAEALTKGSETLLLDVTPLSLGIETMREIVEKIIPRNTPIPVSNTQEFTTYQDDQTAMILHVVQGERETVTHCRSLAHFELRNIPPMIAGVARVRVTFSVDADGLLTVRAQEKTTGQEQSIEVKPSYGLDTDTITSLLRDNLTHAQVDMKNRLLIEARVEARRLYLAVQAALELDGHLLKRKEMATIEENLSKLDELIASSGRDSIITACEALEKATENFAERRINQGIRQVFTDQKVSKILKK
jgi:molecular chaperone HscA